LRAVLKHSMKIVCRRWEFAPSLKLPRYAHAGCFYKHVFYVSGGVTKTNSSSDMLK